MIWLNQYHDLHITTLHGNIILECHNLFEDGRYMLSLIGTSQIDETLETLFGYLRDTGKKSLLNMVPEVVINNLKHPERFIITDEPSNANYILDTEKLAELPGTSFENLRKQVHRFENQYAGRFEVVELDIASSAVVNTLVNHIHLWEKIYTHNDVEKQESYVISTSLTHAEELGFKNLSIYVDGTIQAIALYQITPQPQFVICNHMKINFEYRYISTYLTHALARKLWQQHIPYLNFEQDLGIEGLREHKLRLKPVRYLRSFSVTPAVTAVSPLRST
jgi:hypothetical protein